MGCSIRAASHGKDVLTALRGGRRPAGLGSHVLASWRRCADEFGLDPTEGREPDILDRTELAQRRGRCGPLVEIAKSEMANLYQQVAGSGCSILLSDRDGVVLDCVGDPLFTTAAATTGMRAGAVWTERAQGTNGIGTCLVELRALVIYQQEHFYTKNTGLTCAAAPIFGPTGALEGLLDASSESRMAQQHTMALVNMSAQLIENRLFLHSMREHFILRFHSRPEFVSTLGEGAIAVDPAGRVRAASRSALFQLDLRTVEEIAGRPIHEVFNISADDAFRRAQRHPAHPQPLRDTRRGRRFWASIQPPFDPRDRGLRQIPRPAGRLNLATLSGLEYGDTRMRRNVERARRLIERDITFMILGETGSGKDVFAKAVHGAGPRRDKPFVAVNCASIPETLIESELFGYRPGAFTGASREGSRGKIVQADGGTLFLDEIGDMPVHLQARLLRVLEEREVMPLGGETPIKVDVQLISATHRDLKQQVRDGGFREDLYYRLNGVSLALPALREREDRRALIERLLDDEAGGAGRVIIEPEALEVLAAYEWPGNIRQLRNLLRMLVGLCDNGRIRVNDLPPELRTGDGETAHTRPANPLHLAERDAILRELQSGHWNVTRVASRLSVSRNTLYRKMKLYGIRPPR